jgi:hypothetical protein
MHRLRRFLPAHRDKEATAAVVLRGRRPTLYLDARDRRAVLEVDAGGHVSRLGWHPPLLYGDGEPEEVVARRQEAWYAARQQEQKELGQPCSAPMLALLRALAARGPMRLAAFEAAIRPTRTRKER